MTVLVDTNVWSLALRRDTSTSEPEVQFLRDALTGSDLVVTAGIVLQKLLQGFSGRTSTAQIIERFASLPLLQPTRDDHVDAAEIRNKCRRAGVQIGTIDALLAQLCIRNELILLTTDNDFSLARKHCALRVWSCRP